MTATQTHFFMAGALPPPDRPWCPALPRPNRRGECSLLPLSLLRPDVTRRGGGRAGPAPPQEEGGRPGGPPRAPRAPPRGGGGGAGGGGGPADPVWAMI